MRTKIEDDNREKAAELVDMMNDQCQKEIEMFTGQMSKDKE